MAARILVGTVLLLLLNATGRATPALFDFNDNDAVASPPGGAQPSPTQAGWTGITQTGLAGVSTTFGSLNVSFVPIIGAAVPVLDDRDRGQLGGGTYLMSNMLRDIITITGNPNTTGNGTIDIVVNGMNAGNYLFTCYLHDNTVDHVAMDIELSTTGAAGPFTLEVDNAFVSTGTNPAKIGLGSLDFAADGVNPVHFRIVGQGGTVGFATSENAVFNGFVIEEFTELGDFNRVGGVTVDDFFILSNNLGTHLDGNFVGHAGGDINVDGKVDLDDFGQFKDLFPQVVNAALGVPEPSTMALAFLAVVGTTLAVRRKRASR